MKFEYDVVICTFNGELYIEDQIKSILSQSIPPAKIIISDDGSSDNTIQIAIMCFAAFSFENYQVVKGPKSGIASNFLASLSYSKSDYLFFCDQDDVWLDNKVSIFSEVTARLNDQSPVLIFSDANVADHQLNIKSTSFIKYSGLNVKLLDDDSILFENCVQGASCCINSSLRSIVIDSLRYVDMKNILMHDWWCTILAKYFGRVIFVDKPLILYRQHDLNQVGAPKITMFSFISGFGEKVKKFGRMKIYHYQIKQLTRYIVNADEGYIPIGIKNKFISGYFKLHNLGYLKRILFFSIR